MKRLLIAIIFICLAVGVPATTIATEAPDTQEALVSAILTKMMRYHERVLGVQYDTTVIPFRFVPSKDIDPHSVAAYLFLEHPPTIILHEFYHDCDFQYLLDNLESTSLKDTEPCNMVALRELLSHELGHAYTHTRLRQLGPSSWLYTAFETERKPRISHPQHIVIEGVAEYFNTAFGTNLLPFQTLSPYGNVPQTATTRPRKGEKSFYYSGGNDIVQPIVDAQGVVAGIDWILLHPLTLSQPYRNAIQAYQKAGTNKDAVP